MREAVSTEAATVGAVASTRASAAAISLTLPAASVARARTLTIPSPVTACTAVFTFVPTVTHAPSPTASSSFAIGAAALSEAVIRAIGEVTSQPSLPAVPANATRTAGAMVSAGFT